MLLHFFDDGIILEWHSLLGNVDNDVIERLIL